MLKRKAFILKNMKHNTNLLKMVVYAVILIGVFTGLLEAASASTTIKVADNGHYFEYDGQPVFLLGLGSWHPIDDTDFDYVAHNQWYQSYGLNYNRITLTSTWYTDRSKHVFPWNRSTTPGANDGGNKYDLNEWDPVFWNRLNGYLQDCEDRGIIVCIQFFDECVVEQRSDRWYRHPFNPQNNINNIPDLDTTDASYSSSTGWSKSFYNVNNSVLMTLQDIYVQKLLDETSQYGNVIYEMANEYGGEGSTQFPGHFAWPQHWIDFFSNYENANGVQLLLTNMPFGVNYDQAKYFASPGIDCIDAYRQFPSYGRIEGVNDFLGAYYNEGKPIFAGKIGDDIGHGGNVNENRKLLWTLFVSGGAGSGVKCLSVETWTDDITMEDMLSNIHNFIESGVEFWKMAPIDNLVTSGTAYCLANVGEVYVIYLPDGGSVTVDLSDATGTLGVEWYDPKDGTYYNERMVTGGGNENFTPPFSDDAVLHIVLTILDAGKGTYPSISGTHTGTIKPSDDITVQKMYTYPCPGTRGHSEYMRIWNASGTIAEGNWTGYEGDWHTISFDNPFIMRANETYNYTIRTGSYPQIIHKPKANVTGGTITCDEFVDANGKSYNDRIPAIKLYAAGAASGSSNISDDMVHAGGDTEPPATVLYNSNNSTLNRLLNALKSIKGLYNRLFYVSKLI